MRILIPLFLLSAALFAGEHTGRRAPGFSLPDSNMKMYDLADFRGKVVVLEFMQTDCPHCATFAPILNQIKEKYGDRVAVLSVVNAAHDNADRVRAYAVGHKAGYPFLFDQGQMEYSYVLKTTIDNPYVFLIDGAGVIRNDWGYSPFTRDVFENGKALFGEIDRLLNPRPAAPKAPPQKK